ncbi:LIPOPROTEIN VSAA (FRAGMENT) [Alloactinosynnema sp. L-07]|uniref:DUF6923 family protein n=1 Tax=Alloactinosynnema sp. L-07 TaxID=1653480 RepID=UPI00065EF1FC
MRRRLASAISLGALCVVGAAAMLGGPGEASPRPGGCQFLRVHNVGDTGLSVLTRVRLSDGMIDRVGALGYRIDAIGHVPGSSVSYGLASRGLVGGFRDGAHVVAFDANGAVRDLGPVRGAVPWDRLLDAKAGAIVGGTLVVRDSRRLHSIDIDPRNPTFLHVVRTVELRPAELARTVDDFGVRDGMLYGVTTHVSFHGRVVKIDPTTGSVSWVPGPRLPGGRAYGAALIGPDGALYAAGNRTWGRSRLFRVELREDARVQPVAVWPAVDSADATGCVTGSTPPPGTTPPGSTPPGSTPATSGPNPLPPSLGNGSATQTRPPGPSGSGSVTQTKPPGPPGSGSVAQTVPPLFGSGSAAQAVPLLPGSGSAAQTVPPAPPASGSATQVQPPPPPPVHGSATQVPPPPLSAGGELAVVVPPVPPLPGGSGSVTVAVPPQPPVGGSATHVRPPPPAQAPPSGSATQQRPPVSPVRATSATAPTSSTSPTNPTNPTNPAVQAQPQVPAARKPFGPPPKAVPQLDDDTDDKTAKKRRWSVAVLVLVLGAGAAMAAHRHR